MVTGVSKTGKSSEPGHKIPENKEKGGLPVEALLELLEQERQFYEVLRGVVRQERQAAAAGKIEDMEQLLRKQEVQLTSVMETAQKREVLEQASPQNKDPASSIEVQRSKYKVRQELEMLRLENAQNIQLSQRRLEEVSLTLAALGAGVPSPSYTAGGQSTRSHLDEKNRATTLLDRKV